MILIDWSPLIRTLGHGIKVSALNMGQGRWMEDICMVDGVPSIPAFNNTSFVGWEKEKGLFDFYIDFLLIGIFCTHFWQVHIWSSLVQSWSQSAYCTFLTPANIKLERILEAETVFGCQKRITLGIACRHLKTDSLHQMLWLPTIRKYYQSAKENKRIALADKVDNVCLCVRLSVCPSICP